MFFRFLAQCALYDSGVYARETMNMFLFFGQESGLVKNVNTGIFSDTITVVNVIFCLMILLIELYLFISLYFNVTAMSDSFN